MSFILHPMLRHTATQPQLLADHAEASTELISTAFGAAMALILTGVAVIFWAPTPLLQIQQPLVLIATPLLPGVAALWCWWYTHGFSEQSFLNPVRQPLKADLTMLSEVKPA